MAIENNAVTIDDLNPSYPQQKDYISEGAAHIRLIKQTLQNTFTGIDGPTNIDSDLLNQIQAHIKVDSTGVNFGGLQLVNAAMGAQSTSLVTRAQVSQMIKEEMMDKYYPKGSYWISEDNNLNPQDLFGFGTWEKVTGMIMGSGRIASDGAFLNIPTKVFNVGTTGGRTVSDIKANNVPLLSKNLADFYTATDGDHYHIFGGDDQLAQRSGYVSTGSFRYDAHSDLDGDAHNYRTKSANPGTAHRHRLSGILNMGTDSTAKQPIDIMPPYRVANIWRRVT